MTTTAPRLPDHLPGLDGLRALAILLVIPHNLNLIITPDGTLERVLVSYLDRGWIGVQLFFVLSGFLITGILIDTPHHPGYFGRFYVRRALRIFPLYYATLILVLLVLPALNALPSAIPRFRGSELSYWFFYSNWYGPFHEGEGSLPHLWSLAVEEQFYLIWPLLMYRRSTASIMRLCIGIGIAGLAARLVMLALNAPYEAIYSFLISRMDGLALGGLAAASLRSAASSSWLHANRRRCLVASFLVLCAGGAITRAYSSSSSTTLSIGYSLLGIAFALLVISIVCTDTAKATSGFGHVLRWRALQRIGRYSYAMYLIHVPLGLIAGRPLIAALWSPRPVGAGMNLAYIAFCTVATLLCSALTYVLLEQPFLRLRPGTSADSAIRRP